MYKLKQLKLSKKIKLIKLFFLKTLKMLKKNIQSILMTSRLDRRTLLIRNWSLFLVSKLDSLNLECEDCLLNKFSLSSLIFSLGLNFLPKVLMKPFCDRHSLIAIWLYIQLINMVGIKKKKTTDIEIALRDVQPDDLSKNFRLLTILSQLF